MKQIPYSQQQAANLMETGACDLPLTMEDVAHRVAANPVFPRALQNSLAGNHRLLEMITITAANNLCQEQDQ